MNITPYEEIKVGDKKSLGRLITPHDVERFVELSGDDNPIHVDPDFARETDFKQTVVHGMFTGNLVSALIGKHLPGPGSLWVSQEFRFLAPVRVGDYLVLEAEVVAKHDRERLLDLQIKASVDGRGDVLRGKGSVKLLDFAPNSTNAQDKQYARRALVTGASGSVGGEVAKLLSAQGFHVLAHYSNGTMSAERLARSIKESGGRCDSFQCNLLEVDKLERTVRDLVSRYGPIDVVVANASAPIFESALIHTSAKQLQLALDMQLFANHEIIRTTAPGMEEQGWGRIVGISSDAVHNQPQRGWFSYVLAKSSLEVLIKQCAVELGPKGITANVVAPGMTDTEFVANLSARSRQVVAQTTPNRRLGKPTDVAEAVAFICGASSGHLNGQTIRINGGIGID